MPVCPDPQVLRARLGLLVPLVLQAWELLALLDPLGRQVQLALLDPPELGLRERQALQARQDRLVPQGRKGLQEPKGLPELLALPE